MPNWNPVTLNLQMEQFSLAYIRAVAASAGYQMVRPEIDIDSVDGILMSNFGSRPKIEFQAKATARDIVRDGNVRFSLPIKNYNDLRIPTKVPRILIVVLMPQDPDQWVNQTEDELCLRHCGYWVSLEGRSTVTNTSSVSIDLPTTNIFNKEHLHDLMTKADTGRL